MTIKIVTLNGADISATNENDLSLVARVKLGDFEAEIGGDLSRFKTGSYEDIETSVAPKVGQIEVYKVHHHCNACSTNPFWLETIQPKIGIVSGGSGNTYGQPTEECLERLHNAGVKTYWTEAGAGGQPEPDQDVVAGNVVVQFQPGAGTFTVSYGTKTDQYPLWGTTEPATLHYAWSRNSGIYHYAECKYVARISPAILQRGDTPPLARRSTQSVLNNRRRRYETKARSFIPFTRRTLGNCHRARWRLGFTRRSKLRVEGRSPLSTRGDARRQQTTG